MELPEKVLEIASEEAKKYDDAEEAITRAKRKIFKLSGFMDLAEKYFKHFVSCRVQEIVYDVRSHENRKIRNQTVSVQKVRPIRSKLVSRVNSSVYFSLRIGGNVLGNLFGEELADLAAQEESISAGHAFNAGLLRELIEIVPKNKTVSSSVSSKKMDEIADRVRSGLVGAS